MGKRLIIVHNIFFFKPSFELKIISIEFIIPNKNEVIQQMYTRRAPIKKIVLKLVNLKGEVNLPINIPMIGSKIIKKAYF